MKPIIPQIPSPLIRRRGTRRIRRAVDRRQPLRSLDAAGLPATFADGRSSF